jgi:hypothetical protein
MEAGLHLRTDEAQPTERTKYAAWLAWNGGRSVLWQVVGIVLVWAFLVALHPHNNGLWYQGDSPRHAGNGIFWRDFLLHFPVNPVHFALAYFARYPVIAPTIYPPVFYLVEAVAFSLFGISPFVAKGAVLAFALLAALYMLFWLRDTVGPQLGWGGALLLLQPGIIIWSNAVMLNVPAMALGLAALYHGRRLLDAPRSSHLYLTAGFGVLAILTYVPTAIIVFVLLAWFAVERCGALFRQQRTWIVAGFAALVLAPWAVITIKWAPIQIGMVSGSDYRSVQSLIDPQRWLFYPEQLPAVVTYWVLALAGVGTIIGLASRRWRREVKLALVWILVVYTGFSYIAAREARYVLLLAPPLVLLSVIALVSGCALLSAAFGGNPPRAMLAAMAGLAVLIGMHLIAAPDVFVPAVRGMRRIVAFIDREAPNQRIFYAGRFDGVFSFLIRAGDHRMTQSVTLDSKLLYATAVVPGIKLVKMVSSPQDVIEAFRVRCGCRWLVVEGKSKLREPAPDRYLRQALRGPDFKLVRSFPFHGPDPGLTHIDVYRFLLPIKTPPQQELLFPILGSNKAYRVTPIGH